ncbi:phospho-acceptor domain-containing protein [Pontibacter ummariensis]|uniref:histidine kinase n=1 Tax=Pontibacter ummariensis TaxID=1610492 RepID=A0A239KD75_9BACT|nr:ATP-binding protein [Pontibacter ummariensis]PRY06386.1 phospho-acceptor domain-containing protein [Pontibacter ummariensis]SNT16316.1 His Kinase A (phospho-acceptor) domain-containing protein [Pontibacter ummariensis]
MSKLLLIFLLFFLNTYLLSAQNNGELFLSLEKLSESSYGFELDQHRYEWKSSERFISKGWKFRPGDNQQWRSLGYDDKEWALLDTDFTFTNPPVEWQGIGWFRLKLTIDKSLRNQAVALVMTHYGASEIYLDGKRVHQYGRVSADPEKEQVQRPLFGQPVILALDDKPEHLLAVRYSFHRAKEIHSQYGKLTKVNDQNSTAGFLIHIDTPSKAISLYGESLTKNLTTAMIILGVLLLISFFHLMLYRFYSREKYNLYLSIFTALLAVHSFTKFLPSYATLTFEGVMWSNIVNVLVGAVWLPVSMLAIYSLFYQRIPKYVWFYYLSTPILAYGWAFYNTHPITSQVAFTIALLSVVDIFRVVVRAVLHRQQDAWIIGVGILLSEIPLVAYLFPSMDNYYRFLFLYPVCLAIPLAMSVLIARRTARAYKQLGHQLNEVEKLSARSIAQEKEKQQILALQNETLERQVSERTAELRESFESLTRTQAQLVQKEKMASLGELTAGIAHEIQNPLNFVNNFSEVSKEMITELQQELDTGDIDEAKAISVDIKQNLQKIHYHGSRADAIVKNMLQHSHGNTGEKELANLNIIIEEYLRLSYYGIRAKDKAFTCTLEINLDQNLEKVEVVPQELGRVLLNLFNNAFYAVQQKLKLGLPKYEPKVTVDTQRKKGQVEIRVRDNGIGIPEGVQSKIFQPFFTTKPTGQGTGLGLSLSYDIISKGHGGELSVASKEGEWSEFTVLLPYIPVPEELLTASVAPLPTADNFPQP